MVVAKGSMNYVSSFKWLVTSAPIPVWRVEVAMTLASSASRILICRNLRQSWPKFRRFAQRS